MMGHYLSEMDPDGEARSGLAMRDADQRAAERRRASAAAPAQADAPVPPLLDWRAVGDGSGDWYQGYSGDLMVADVSESHGLGTWRWSVPLLRSYLAHSCSSTAMSLLQGSEFTQEAARAAAEREWAAWLAAARLAPLGAAS